MDHREPTDTPPDAQMRALHWATIAALEAGRSHSEVILTVGNGEFKPTMNDLLAS